MPKNILEALFDVKPMTKSGILDFEKIQRIKPQIDLRPPVAVAIEEPVEEFMGESVIEPSQVGAFQTEMPQMEASPMEVIPAVSEIIPPPAPKPTLNREVLLNEFEQTISEPIDVAVELASIGGKVHNFFPKKSKPKPYYSPNKTRQSYISDISRQNLAKEPKSNQSPQKIENFWHQPKTSPATDYVWPQSRLMNYPSVNEPEKLAAVIKPARAERGQYLSHSEREMEVLLAASVSEKLTERQIIRRSAKNPEISPAKNLARKKKLLIIPVIAILVIAFLGYRGGLKIKNNITVSGNHAVTNLKNAKDDLAHFDFLKAADNFALAYDDFNQASENLGGLGASFLSNFGNLPGLSSVNSANNLIKAGQYISKAGENLALAFGSLSQTNFLSKQPLSKSLADFREVLVYADKNISSAKGLLADIDSSILPQEKQQLFIDFRDKIPEFQKYIGSAIDYSDFLLNAVGSKTAKKYLVLFQNNTELRATGGFPGSYAVLIFENGSLKGVTVDDVYNIDGQLKENIIPPKPLQHITPNWGMRDANWFADFPTSAKKVEEFYKKDTGGAEVDGVMAITPQVIEKILDVVGPIPMPEYGLTLDSNNFLQAIQQQVEYGDNRAQPKTIIKDLQPKLFAKLAGEDKDHWLEIFKILTGAVEEKQFLSYFNDPSLQKFAVANNLAGQIKQTQDDYLQIVLSNVKGSKTDAVIDNSFKLESKLSDNSNGVSDGSSGGGISHKLTISRSHKGGSDKFGFYNKINPSYIRVYAPAGSVLENIDGYSMTDFRPLIGYADYNFKKDPDLAAIENSVKHPFEGVDVFQESGKTVFGFWLVIKPKETKTVELDYTTPKIVGSGAGYLLLWQKQSGTNRDPITFSFDAPEGKKIINSDLSVDREIQLDLK